MKAIVCPKYGSPDVLQLQEVAKPAPQDDEVLIKIHAASINSRDWRMHASKSVLYPPDAGRSFCNPKTRSSGLM